MPDIINHYFHNCNNYSAKIQASILFAKKKVATRLVKFRFYSQMIKLRGSIIFFGSPLLPTI